MSQLYDTQGWGFQHELRTKYGPVSMLRTLFGVSNHLVWGAHRHS